MIRLRRKPTEGQAAVITKKIEVDQTSVALYVYEESHQWPVKQWHYTKE
ncbi:hypothetical protein PI125_g14793 [Phytophthora idaei]|nr:hypothetical protein PI125_g14793 [Phytophthora idaei]